MECKFCGRYAPPDPETGYDADDCCPECASSLCTGCYQTVTADSSGLCPTCRDERDDCRFDDEIDRLIDER